MGLWVGGYRKIYRRDIEQHCRNETCQPVIAYLPHYKVKHRERQRCCYECDEEISEFRIYGASYEMVNIINCSQHEDYARRAIAIGILEFPCLYRQRSLVRVCYRVKMRYSAICEYYPQNKI